MFNKLKLVFSNPNIVKRIGITLLILLVWKIGTYIPIPLIDTTAISSTIKTNDFLTIMNSFTGGALGNFSVLALGISPYITASIIIEMLQMNIIPKFKEWAEEGETGKEKLNRITRYTAVALAFLQAIALLFGLGNEPTNILTIEAASNPNLVWLYYIYMAIIVTAGTAFVLWLADLITRYGVGNGSSLFIVAGILSSLPSMFTLLWSKYLDKASVTVTFKSVMSFIIIILLYVLIIVGVVYMEGAKRKIPVQHANRSAGNPDSNIPIKINASSVIPVIFASTLLSIPTTIIGLLGLTPESSGVAYWFNQIFSYQNVIGFILYVVLIYLFSFFYAFLTIDPDKIADNLQKSNAYVPGYRQGEDTKEYISKVLFRITLIGATYLTILAIIPIVISKIFAFTAAEASTITVGGTGILIVVGVAIETLKQIETDASETSYSDIG